MSAVDVDPGVRAGQSIDGVAQLTDAFLDVAALGCQCQAVRLEDDDLLHVGCRIQAARDLVLAEVARRRAALGGAAGGALLLATA